MHYILMKAFYWLYKPLLFIFYKPGKIWKIKFNMFDLILNYILEIYTSNFPSQTPLSAVLLLAILAINNTIL